jgi:ABC-type dipeptide/oligopeptide/nickel transport system permease component
VAVITFLLTFVVPGDPAQAIGGRRASPETVERLRAALGLDDPMPVQLGRYLLNALTGDFGYSYHHREDVLPLLLQRFPATAQLALAGIAVSLAIGVPLGVLGARRRGEVWDRLASGISVLFVSVPAFWLGYMLIDYLAFRPLMAWDLELFAIGGYEPGSLRHLVLPALTLGLTGAAYYTRLTRNAVLEELHRDYVRTARAKGLSDRSVTWRHAVRNALPPVVTQLGLDVGFFLGGVVIIEQVFSWPGIGRLAVASVGTDDVPLIMGTVLFATVCIVVANLVVDLVVAVLDPRLRR